MARADGGRRRRPAMAALDRILPGLAVEAQQRLGRAEAVAFLARLDVQLLDFYEPLDELYGAGNDGDPRYAGFYTSFPDRTMPDAYEATIADVFPDRAPGSFTWFDDANGGSGGWVWTTFWSYQWDLNYGNPNVFAAMLETVLGLANRGIDIFRMDAVPFMWKRLGTSCMNQPEVHSLMQALHALVKLAAPATIFKAEAIVSPEDLVSYLGGHERYRPECELAYHN